MSDYLNREQRRKSFKRNKKKLGETWEDFNARFITKEPYRKDVIK